MREASTSYRSPYYCITSFKERVPWPQFNLRAAEKSAEDDSADADWFAPLDPLGSLRIPAPTEKSLEERQVCDVAPESRRRRSDVKMRHSRSSAISTLLIA